MAKSIGKNTRVEPKSGCKKINKIGTKNTAAIFSQNFKFFFPSLRANIAAAIMHVPIFANSDGWTDTAPKSIQRVAL